MAPELIPLYDKVRHLRELQRSGFPGMVWFTPEEQSQMHLLPNIYLEAS